MSLFDASPVLISNSVLFRWDVVHFAQIARHGYQFEQNWAFLPALPFLIRTLHPLLLLLLTLALFCDSARVFYLLSLHHLNNTHAARIALVLALIPSSPVTLCLAPYNEPFFTYLSYRGMLFCARKQWLPAAFAFTLAALFRPNGIFLAAFILWGLLIQPCRPRPLSATLLTSLIFSPFVYHNYAAYTAFCTNTPSPASWCSNWPPSIYTHVQSKYWNVGFLRYWSWHQLPNFIIAAPPFLLLYAFVFTHRSFSHPLTPHILYTFFIVSLLLFSSHTQIILRLAASIPTTYWAAAWLVIDHPFFARAWITWSIIWASISLILWLAFLPPA